MITAVFCGSGWLPIVDEIRRRLPAGVTLRQWDRSRSLCDELADAQVILPSNAPIDAAAIAAPRELRLVQQPAVGHEKIDLSAAAARGVPVCNVPAANGDAVAEATMLMILALTRRLPRARHTFAAGVVGEPVGVELRGKTLGLIGVGGAGSRVAALATAFGMQVLSVRSTSTRADFEDLLRRADFVSIHCPLTDATRGLFDHAAFALMKPGAQLVNCARGGIIDRSALEAALAGGRLGGVALDTFWNEPWDPADPLYAHPDVMTLPHIGGSTVEAFGRIADVVAGNIARLQRGEPLLHRIA